VQHGTTFMQHFVSWS